MSTLTRNTKQFQNVWITEHRIDKNDSLWNIVKNANLPPEKWRKYYDAAYNMQFRRTRTRLRRNDPNLIYKGELIWLPTFSRDHCVTSANYMNVTAKKIENIIRNRKEIALVIQTTHEKIKKTEKNWKEILAPIEQKLEKLSKLTDECYKQVARLRDDEAMAAMSRYCQADYQTEENEFRGVVTALKNSADQNHEVRIELIKGLALKLTELYKKEQKLHTVFDSQYKVLISMSKTCY